MNISLPKSLTTVTTFSKLLALLLFILFPFVGFFLGLKYGNATIQYVPIENLVKVPVNDSRATLVLRCGDIPDVNLNIIRGYFTMVNGPDWSPDCRHITWSVWQTGTGTMSPGSNDQNTGPFPFEGIFLYTDATEKIQKVVTPKFGETLEFQNWKDRNTFVFTRHDSRGEGTFLYDVSTGSILNQSAR